MAPSSDAQPGAATGKWLSVIGIGEGGVDDLGRAAHALISGAAVVFGGKRHLALAADLIRGEARAWPTPFDSEMSAVRALRGQNVCVLASGDPFLHGVGVTLARHIPAAEMTVIPAPSAFSLAASRLGWALQDIETISLHGRPISLLRPLLASGAHIIALTSDGDGPAAVAQLLTKLGFGGSTMTVLEALGGARERISRQVAESFAMTGIDALNVVAIEVKAHADAPILCLTPGRAENLFQHDGQITKREMRAVTLAALAPRRGELLLDIGAGSGSVSIEWMLAHASLRAIAVEADPARAARIRVNADALGVPGLTIVERQAPDALAGLPAPDAIFVGGGGSDPGAMEAAIDLLKSGGRLVANAVTLEMEAVLLAHRARLGGDLIRIGVSRAEPVGGMTGWRQAMPVTQWSWVKP